MKRILLGLGVSSLFLLLATGCSVGVPGDLDSSSANQKQTKVSKSSQALTKTTSTLEAAPATGETKPKGQALRPNATRGGCTEQQFDDGCAQFGRGHVLFCDCGLEAGGTGVLKPNKAGACTEQQLDAGCFDMSKGHVRFCDCPMTDNGDGSY
ncbi:MAG: hypothetical protein EP343_05425 [Deltaproteobacteria bacterium]|nr:MAG: hypothetical protein EP343_05425 [Deltaproteobacteria bacterium]